MTDTSPVLALPYIQPSQAQKHVTHNEALRQLEEEKAKAQAAAALENARSMGAEDSLIEFEGLTPQMVEALAEDGVKTLEDFATCADWELAGGWTTEGGERVKDDGLLEKFDVDLAEAQNLIMTARVLLGWVDPAELEPEVDEDEEADDTEVEAGAETGEEA